MNSASWMAFLAVGAGGAVGAALRHAMGLATAQLEAPAWVGTLAVNVLGAFAMGVLSASGAAGRTRLFFGTGLLGGFTTFSALALDASSLGTTRGAAYALGSVALGLAAFAGGQVLARALDWRLE